jgi:hypothetical protein
LFASQPNDIRYFDCSDASLNGLFGESSRLTKQPVKLSLDFLGLGAMNKIPGGGAMITPPRASVSIRSGR